MVKSIFLVCLLFGVVLLVSARQITDQVETQTTPQSTASVGGMKKEAGVKPDFLGFHRHHHGHGGGRYPPASEGSALVGDMEKEAGVKPDFLGFHRHHHGPGHGRYPPANGN